MPYTEVLPHSRERPKPQVGLLRRQQAIANILRINLYNSTWLALGASLQAALVLLPIPKLYAIAPATLYLFSRIILTVLITAKFLPNPYLEGSIQQRYTAIVPDPDGNFPEDGKSPTSNGVAILILSAKVNHPLGWLGAPQVKNFSKLFDKMREDLENWPQSETGFLGQSSVQMPTQNGCVEIHNISYWRSAAHILKYADSPNHRDAVRWWSNNAENIPHIGIMHEMYEAAPGMWESVYLNFQPTMLGATSYLRKGEKLEGGVVPDEWISPIIEARRGRLAGSRGRMGWDVKVGGKPDF